MAAQRQDSLLDQLRDLADIARKEGMYDAMDFVLSQVVSIEMRSFVCDHCTGRQGIHYDWCSRKAS